MKQKLYIRNLIIAILLLCINDSLYAKGFYSNRPARTWEEYLVSGNGTMGLMVAGNPYNEEMVINHTNLFLPLNPPSTPPSQGNHLDEIRKMMLNGEYKAASDRLVDISHADGFGKKRQSDLYIPAFQINLCSDSLKTTSYRRSVDFLSGEAKVEWANSKGQFIRSSFVSRPSNVIVSEIRAIKGKLNFTIDINTVNRFDPKRKAKFGLDDKLGISEVDKALEPDHITIKVTYQKFFRGSIKGCEGEILINHIGGKILVRDGKLVVKDAKVVMLKIMAEPVNDMSINPSTLFSYRFDQVRDQDYESLLAPHRAQMAELMNRVSLNLNAEDSQRELSSEELLKLGGSNPALIEHLFDAARYNIISATGTNPPNLQGIWGATMTPPWAGDYTTNGNLPTAVSHYLAASTPELMLPLFNKLESQIDYYRTNARVLFNCRGIHIPSHIQLHGYDNQFDATWPMTFWTAGAAWYSLFFYDYYLYNTKDEKFLTEHALPFMKESMDFYEDFLERDSVGTLIFNPSYSPENHPRNNKSQACINATMDIALCKALLRDLISVAESHNIYKEKIGLWKDMLNRLPRYEVNKEGELREWSWKDLEDNHQHRHASHLIGLYYRKDPEIMQNDTLRAGALKAIKQRLTYRKSQSGVMAFGLSQLCFPACLLGQSDLAGEMLTMAGDTYFNNNMMTTHS